jgi:hypothetical protein
MENIEIKKIWAWVFLAVILFCLCLCILGLVQLSGGFPID